MKKEAYFKLMGGLLKQARPSWSDQQLTAFGVPSDQWSQYRYKYAGLPGGRHLLKKHLVGQGIYAPGQVRPGEVQSLPNGNIQLTPQGRTRYGTANTSTTVPTIAQPKPAVQPVKSNLLPEKTTISDQASQY